MEDKEAPNSAFTMSIKGMAMLTVCSVFSLRNLPSMAEYGWNIIFFLSAAAACFFIPSALVSAELASTYPQRGGVFIWVKEAFRPQARVPRDLYGMVPKHAVVSGRGHLCRHLHRIHF